ncbi:MAG: hypothetical protein H0T42_02945 [Deltaproteobacteria bacterium]|nr:hypothetical protein [Deltaproteobacteria bacterium]
MAMTPEYALVHVFLPNLVKLKGAATVIGVIERKEKFFFDPVWGQAHIEHVPFLLSQVREPYRIGVVDLPPPKELGEAFYVGLVANKKDPTMGRYFTLEKDYVLKTKSDRTLVCEREGAKHTKHFDGPVLTGNKDVDAAAFIEAFMELLIPTKVTHKKDRQW